jgi:isoamylase
VVGTPMLLMGDEMRRTQQGNNNAYCQDNEISWLDWKLLNSHADLHRFVKMMVSFRARRDVASEDSSLSLNQLLGRAQLEWHGVNLHTPDWSDDSHSIAFTVSSLRGSFTIHVMLNGYWEPLTFELPPGSKATKGGWRRWIDTSLPSPDDICPWEAAPILTQPKYLVAARSSVLLVEPSE